MFRQNCSKNQSLAEHSDVIFSYIILIFNAIFYPFSAFSMASVLVFCGDVDVGLHGFVIGMAGEFHHNLRRDADGEGHADAVQ